jgi:hypothetical protein
MLPQLHQQTMAAEEFAALQRQRQAQRQGTADCRHVPLMVVCNAAEVPEIREDLTLRRATDGDSDCALRGASTLPGTGRRAGKRDHGY